MEFKAIYKGYKLNLINWLEKGKAQSIAARSIAMSSCVNMQLTADA